MTETMPHPVDLALRAATTTLEPNRADFDTSRAKLTDAIAAATPHQRTRSRRSWAIGLALLVVVAVLLTQTVSTSPAAAVITELAEVAEARDPLTISDSQFAYTITEGSRLFTHDSLHYTLPYTSEQWSGDQGTVRLQETNHEPQFFSTADEEAYYAAGLDVGDRLGETVVTTQEDSNPILDEEDWSTDPRELETMIRRQVGDDEFTVLEKCLEFLRAPLLPPELRAAVLRVISGLDLELVDDGPKGATFSMSLDTPLPLHLRFTLDDAGHLRFEERIQTDGYPEQGVPPGTVDYTATYSVPVLVDSLERP